jgi:hypothetical protein
MFKVFGRTTSDASYCAPETLNVGDSIDYNASIKIGKLGLFRVPVKIRFEKNQEAGPTLINVFVDICRE